MTKELPQTTDPAVGSTRLVGRGSWRYECFQCGASWLRATTRRPLRCPGCKGTYFSFTAWVPPNVGTERCGRPCASERATDGARPHSLQ